MLASKLDPLFPPGLEPGTFRVLGERDNHYTTETRCAAYMAVLCACQPGKWLLFPYIINLQDITIIFSTLSMPNTNSLDIWVGNLLEFTVLV